MDTRFSRLIRFEDTHGVTHFGEAGNTLRDSLQGQSVPTYMISTPLEKIWHLSGKTAQVAKILSPLERVPIVIGIGLNYKKHAEEAGFAIPEYPLVFTKYADALAGPYDEIPIVSTAQQLDYEGELCMIIGKDVKDLGDDENPLDYVLGYTVGDDISSRYWQNPSRSGGQHGYAKSFDKFAPIGPAIVSPEVVGDPEKLELKVWVNGELRQDSCTDDLIFSPGAIIRHLSQGMTLREGTVIMTGTPSGVGAFLNPPRWLADGDIVEVEIEKLGRIKNLVTFMS